MQISGSTLLKSLTCRWLNLPKDVTVKISNKVINMIINKSTMVIMIQCHLSNLSRQTVTCDKTPKDNIKTNLWYLRDQVHIQLKNLSWEEWVTLKHLNHLICSLKTNMINNYNIKMIATKFVIS